MDSLVQNFSTSNFPYPILRACAELPYSVAFRELPDGFIKIVIKIIQKINLKSPFSEIYASRQTLANEAGKSLDSVNRAIQWLEANELIARERKARPGLRGSTSPLIPTLPLLFALGLVDKGGKRITWSSMSGRAKPESKDSNQAAQPSVSKSVSKSVFTRVGTVFIPADLKFLVNQGLSAFAVLGLMKLAKNASQQLTDIAASTQKYLVKLQGNQLYAYIKTLIQSGRDFSAKNDESVQVELLKKEKAYLSEKAEIYEGRAFFSRKTGTLYRVEQGVIREETAGITRVGPFRRSFLDAIENGILQSQQ